MVAFWQKISEDKPSKIATKFFNLMLKLKNTGEYDFKWLNKVQSILESTGYSNLWANQYQYATKKYITKQIPIAIKESVVSVTMEKIQSGSRCTNYRIFKQNLNFEIYLTKLSPRHRITMSKFRCGYNKLPVNDFRFFRSANPSERNCKICKQGDWR